MAAAPAAAIAFDLAGGDNAPEAPLAAARDAAAAGVALILLGTPAEAGRTAGLPGVEFVACDEAIGMDEDGAAAWRRKRSSSIARGLALVAGGRARAFLSAGNTGAVVVGAALALGLEPGVRRPALAQIMPSAAGHFVLVDVGACVRREVEDLVTFGRLGAAYARQALAVARPRIGLLNVGAEPGKGPPELAEAHARMTAELPGFAGNIEGPAVWAGAADVVVTDGFTGNIFLKGAEGLAGMIAGSLRASATAGLRGRLAAALARPVWQALFERLNYRNYAAAPLLGVRGHVYVAHGRSDRACLRRALEVVDRATRPAAERSAA